MALRQHFFLPIDCHEGIHVSTRPLIDRLVIVTGNKDQLAVCKCNLCHFPLQRCQILRFIKDSHAHGEWRAFLDITRDHVSEINQLEGILERAIGL